MNTNALWEALTQIFRDTFEDNELTICSETTADDIDDWDSLSHIQLIVAVEQTFGMHFNTGEVAGLANVGELMDRIVQQTLNGTDK